MQAVEEWHRSKAVEKAMTYEQKVRDEQMMNHRGQWVRHALHHSLLLSPAIAILDQDVGSSSSGSSRKRQIWMMVVVGDNGDDDDDS